MSDDDKSRLPSEKKAEERAPLPKVIELVPLLSVILQILELVLKILGIID